MIVSPPTVPITGSTPCCRESHLEYLDKGLAYPLKLYNTPKTTLPLLMIEQIWENPNKQEYIDTSMFIHILRATITV